MPMSASIQSWRIRSGFHSGLLLACLKFPKAGNRAGQSLTGRGVKFLLTVQSSSLCALLCKFLAVPCSSLQFLAVFHFRFPLAWKGQQLCSQGGFPSFYAQSPQARSSSCTAGLTGRGTVKSMPIPQEPTTVLRTHPLGKRFTTISRNIVSFHIFLSPTPSLHKLRHSGKHSLSQQDRTR